jgi:predicted esterase
VRVLVLTSWLISQLAAAPAGTLAVPVSRAHLHSGTVRQATEIPRGEIVESVVCSNDPSQSYALYLPSNYTPDRKWPVLYAFDPGARGRVALERFREAAEQYSWILVGSNNSRNGPLRPSVDAWNAIAGDTRERFAIDGARVYAAGFSGAARAAIQLATLCRGCISGVIVCGAGFPVGITPSPALHFAVFAAAGEEDFNYPEVQELGDALAKAGMPHRVEIFAGRHEWVPASVATSAVEWLELKAMQAGTRPPDSRVVAALQQKALERAEALENVKKPLDAYRVYAGAVDAFRGLSDTGQIASKSDQMRDRPDVRDAIRNEQWQIKKQRELEARISDLIARDQGSRVQERAGVQERSGPEGRIDEQLGPDIQRRELLADLRSQARSVQDSPDRRIARRVLDGLLVGLFQQGLDFLQARKLSAKAVRTFTLATEVYPDRSGAFYYLAWAHAANGDRKDTLQALKNAVARGFSDLPAITGNEAFDAIRNDPQYEEMVLRIGKPK